MSLVIDMTDETNELDKSQFDTIEELLNFAAEVENVADQAEISVTFVDNERIREINRNYRKKDYATDVISFAMEELGEGEIEIISSDIPPILGDLIISIPKAKEQASDYGHSFIRELGFLAVHGFLHLLGYDHMTDKDEVVMFTKQKEILEAYGLKR